MTSDVLKFIDEAIDVYAKYKNATTKVYQNIHHIMMKEVEVQVSAETEMYTFKLKEGWIIDLFNNNEIVLKKYNKIE